LTFADHSLFVPIASAPCALLWHIQHHVCFVSMFGMTHVINMFPSVYCEHKTCPCGLVWWLLGPSGSVWARAWIQYLVWSYNSSHKEFCIDNTAFPGESWCICSLLITRGHSHIICVARCPCWCWVQSLRGYFLHLMSVFMKDIVIFISALISMYSWRGRLFWLALFADCLVAVLLCQCRVIAEREQWRWCPTLPHLSVVTSS